MTMPNCHTVTSTYIAVVLEPSEKSRIKEFAAYKNTLHLLLFNRVFSHPVSSLAKTGFFLCTEQGFPNYPRSVRKAGDPAAFRQTLASCSGLSLVFPPDPLQADTWSRCSSTQSVLPWSASAFWTICLSGLQILVLFPLFFLILFSLACDI